MKNEIRILKKIENHEHPNIVQILKHGSLKGSQYYYIDMELCQLNLAQYIEGNWPEAVQGGVYFRTTEASVAHCWDIMKDIARGLAFFHGMGEVHRDLKPHNGGTHCRSV